MKNDNQDAVIKPVNDSIIHKISDYLTKNSPGMRVIKTALAVIICLLIENLRAADMPTHACIATVVCMQPTLRTTFQASIDRTLGTIIAGAYSYLMAVLLITKIGMDPQSLLFYLVVGILSFPLMAILITIKKTIFNCHHRDRLFDHYAQRWRDRPSQLCCRQGCCHFDRSLNHLIRQLAPTA